MAAPIAIPENKRQNRNRTIELPMKAVPTDETRNRTAATIMMVRRPTLSETRPDRNAPRTAESTPNATANPSMAGPESVWNPRALLMTFSAMASQPNIRPEIDATAATQREYRRACLGTSAREVGSLAGEAV